MLEALQFRGRKRLVSLLGRYCLDKRSLGGCLTRELPHELRDFAALEPGPLTGWLSGLAGYAPLSGQGTGYCGKAYFDGIELAFAQTYRLDTDDATQLVGQLLQKLREGHGGLLKIRIDGAGPLDAGANRVLTLRAHLAQKLKPGHSYHGSWRLEPLRIKVRVSVRHEARGGSK